eukprot:COSAG02_NODE_2690_length_8228_cov_10.450732_5_plen_57_part_00
MSVSIENQHSKGLISTFLIVVFVSKQSLNLLVRFHIFFVVSKTDLDRVSQDLGSPP